MAEIVSLANRNILATRVVRISFMKILKMISEMHDPCGTPEMAGLNVER